MNTENTEISISRFIQITQNNTKIEITGEFEGNDTRIIVRNILGYPVFYIEIKTNQFYIDLEKQPKGAYFFEIIGSDLYQVKKVVIY